MILLDGEICRTPGGGDDWNACVGFLEPIEELFLEGEGSCRNLFQEVVFFDEVGGEIIQFDPRIVTFAVGGSVAIEVDELPIAFPDGAKGFDS